MTEEEKIEVMIEQWMQWEKLLKDYVDWETRRCAEEVDERIMKIYEELTPMPDYILEAFDE